MKKILYTLFMVVAVLGSCTIIDQTDNGRIDNPPVFTAIIDEVPATRTYIDKTFQQLWSENDCISVFSSLRYAKYRYIGINGDGNGCFAYDNINGLHTSELGSNYAVYPYSASVSTDNGDLNIYLPSNQKYREGSFAPGANTMVAVTENCSDYLLRFKNVCGYIVVRLYGEGTIKFIRLEGNKHETIAGPATVRALYGEAPVVEMTGNGDRIYIDCGVDGVQLNSSSSNPTEFWFCVPPTVFSQGFTVTAYTTDGKMMKKSVNSTRVVERNVINRMNPIEASFNSPVGEAILADGPSFNVLLKELTDSTKVFAKDTMVTDAVKRIVFSPRNPSTAGVIVSDIASEYPAYATYDPIADEIVIASTAEQFELGRDASNMFRGFKKCEEIVGLTELGTENCENMAYLFAYCSAMKEFDLMNFNTENCTALNHMFWNCKAATKIDVTRFNTENNSSMWSMFCHCDNITELDVSNFNTSGVTTMSYAFAYCYKLQHLDLSNFDASATTTVSNLVYDCRELQTLKLGELFDTSHDPTMSYMFCRCPYLGEVWFGPSFISSKKPTNFWGYTGTDDFVNGDYLRTGNKAGGITIRCTQDTADWLATTGLRWLHTGYNEASGHQPININFVDYTTGIPLTVTWSPN